MDKNYTPKARRRRRRKLMESIVFFGDIIDPFIDRIETDGGTVDAVACLNEELWKLIYN